MAKAKSPKKIVLVLKRDSAGRMRDQFGHFAKSVPTKTLSKSVPTGHEPRGAKGARKTKPKGKSSANKGSIPLPRSKPAKATKPPSKRVKATKKPAKVQAPPKRRVATKPPPKRRVATKPPPKKRVPIKAPPKAVKKRKPKKPTGVPLKPNKRDSRKRAPAPKPVHAPIAGERGVRKVQSTRDLLKESLENVCSLISGGEACLSVRTFVYADQSVDGELRMRAPSRAKMTDFMIDLEEHIRLQDWPEGSWFSLGIMGEFRPSKHEWADYGKKHGMDLIEFYPQKLDGLAVHLQRARETLKALFHRQKVSEIMLRLNTGKKQPNRRMIRGFKRGE